MRKGAKDINHPVSGSIERMYLGGSLAKEQLNRTTKLRLVLLVQSRELQPPFRFLPLQECCDPRLQRVICNLASIWGDVP